MSDHYCGCTAAAVGETAGSIIIFFIFVTILPTLISVFAIIFSLMFIITSISYYRKHNYLPLEFFIPGCLLFVFGLCTIICYEKFNINLPLEILTKIFDIIEKIMK